MPFPIHINIVDLVFKGMLIGMIASAPMGPVGILCVQRTLNKGRWFGMVTGIGAAISDIFYAGITGFGMAFVMDFVNNDQNKFYLQIIGSVLLLAFGIFTWRTDPTKNMHRSGQQRGEMVVGFASIVGGALLWWYGLTWLVDKIRSIFQEDGIRIINQIIGVIVIIFSVISLFGTVTNLFRFF